MRHRRTRMGWICATAAPWALGAGMLVSFTASAGNDPMGGISASPLATLLAVEAQTAGALVPRSDLLAGPIVSVSPRPRGPWEAAPEASPLRADPKAQGGAPPAVVRSAKGDPLRAMDPSLSRRGGELGREAQAARLLFRSHERALPAAVLTPGIVESLDPDRIAALEPWRQDDSTITQRATAAKSPAAAAAGSTGPGRGGSTTPGRDGATPSVPRATALSSATPAPLDAMPAEIAAAPVLHPRGGLSHAAKPEPDRPRYADLVDPDHAAREQRCLAEAVYFEARSEPEEGQAAVAQVVLNRVQSGLYPASICGVVYQNRHRHLACQFTFACEGKSLRITDQASWDSARRVAANVLEGRTYLAEVGASTHYHADYVRPSWARRLKKMDVIGRHIFYRLKPGQT